MPAVLPVRCAINAVNVVIRATPSLTHVLTVVASSMELTELVPPIVHYCDSFLIIE